MSIDWVEYFRGQQDRILEELRTLVEMESPTNDKAAVDRLGALIAKRFEALGCKVEKLPQETYGDQLRVEYGEGDEQIMVLGHFDTVKDIGTLEQDPWRVEDGKAYGPGTYDMKAGIVYCYFALQAIKKHGLKPQKKLVFFWNTDEEVGSKSSRRLIQEEGRKSALALVVEPAAGDGSLKTSRKGGGEFHLRVKGKEAHAGNDHRKGINAIEELAHHVLTIQGWTDYAKGTTLSVGMIKGGTASNVVPASAEAVIDVRVEQASEAERITALMKGLKPVLEGAELIVEGAIDKLPMERTAGTERLFRHAQVQAKELGLPEVTEMAVGGTSDGNVVAVVGIPVLDGLGPHGDGAHAPGEHIKVEPMAGHIALLVKMFTTL